MSSLSTSIGARRRRTSEIEPAPRDRDREREPRRDRATAAAVATIAAARRRARSRSNPPRRDRRHADPPRARGPAPRSREIGTATAIETRTAAATANAPTCRSEAGAIDPSRPAAVRRRAWSSQPEPWPDRPDRPSQLRSQPDLPFEEEPRRAAAADAGPSLRRHGPKPRSAPWDRGRRPGRRNRSPSSAGRRSRPFERGAVSAMPTRRAGRPASFDRSSRSIPTCLPAAPNGRGAAGPGAPGELEGHERGRHRPCLPHSRRPTGRVATDRRTPASRRSSRSAAASPEGAEGAAAPSPPPGRPRPGPPADREGPRRLRRSNPSSDPTILAASPISRSSRGSTSHRGAAAGARRSVPAAESGNGRARPRPPGPGAGTSGTRPARPGRIRRPNDAGPARPNAAPNRESAVAGNARAAPRSRSRPGPAAASRSGGRARLRPSPRAAALRRLGLRRRPLSRRRGMAGTRGRACCSRRTRPPRCRPRRRGRAWARPRARDRRPARPRPKAVAGAAAAAGAANASANGPRASCRPRLPSTSSSTELRGFRRGRRARRGPSPAAARPADESLGDLDDLDLEELDGAGRSTLDDDEFAGDELADRPAAPVDEEIDLELEQEIRREIEEIEELEREMGLRGPADARPRRGEEPARGGRSGRGRGLAQAADPGDLPPRRRGAGPGHQGEHRHQGADPLDLYQHPRPIPRADARAQPRRRLAQDRRRRPAPQAPRDHARAQSPQGPGLHRPDRRPGAHQARAGPRPRLPAAALEGHPPPHQEVQGARRRSIKNRT